MMEIQDQIYIVSGALGGVSILLIIATLVLFSRVSKLKKAIDRLKVEVHKNRNSALVSPAPLPKQDVSLPIPAAVPTRQQAYSAAAPPVTSTVPLLQPNIGNLGPAYNSHGNTTSVIERERDLTAGGVRVLPTLYKSSEAPRKSNYDASSGYN